MQEWLLRRYREHGASYVAWCLWPPTVLVLVILSPVSTAVVSRYDGLSLGKWTLSLATAEPWLILAVVIGWLVGRYDMRVVSRWARGDRDELSPRQVAESVRRLPRRIFFTVGGISAFVAGPIGTLETMSSVQRQHLSDFTILMLSGMVYAVWAIVVILVWAELAMRPVLYDVVEADPSLSATGVFRYQLRYQLAAAVGSAILVGGLYSGEAISRRGNFSELVQLVMYGLLVTLGLGAVLVPLYLALLAEPLRALTQASRQVADGDMSVRVGVTSSDELGELSHAFNVMVSGLAERDSLRATNSALVADLRESRRRLVAAGNGARRQVEIDLHDGAQQQLALVRLKVSMLTRRISAGADAASVLDELETSLDRAINDLNELAQGIYPDRLEADGIASALEDALAFVPCPAKVVTVGLRRYPAALESAVYFCCREAFQNVTKHAGDRATITVELRDEDDVLTFRVSDTGVGFSTQCARSAGLQNITDRLSALEGTLEVDSAPGQGTTLTGRVPIRGSDPARG